MITKNQMRPCFFCGIRNTERMYEIPECPFLEGYRVAVGFPADAVVGWAICDECGRLDSTAITSHIHEDMMMKAVNRYRAGQSTVIYNEEMLKDFEARVLALHKRNRFRFQDNPATCQEEWHRTSSTFRSAPACPRCGGALGTSPGGISRVDGKTEICSACEGEEAMTRPNNPWKEEVWAKEQRARWIRQ